MGVKLTKLYEFVSKNGGMQDRMRIAMKCGFASTKAADMPDSPENVQKLAASIKEVMGVNPPSV